MCVCVFVRACLGLNAQLPRAALQEYLLLGPHPLHSAAKGSIR